MSLVRLAGVYGQVVRGARFAAATGALAVGAGHGWLSAQGPWARKTRRSRLRSLAPRHRVSPDLVELGFPDLSSRALVNIRGCQHHSEVCCCGVGEALGIRLVAPPGGVGGCLTPLAPWSGL